MRPTVVLLVVLLAGCSAPKGDEGRTGPGGEGPFEVPVAFDQLTSLLPANSTEWQDFLVVEDEVALGNDSMQFTTGRGMGCQGNVDNVSVESAGWLVCMVRLAARPDAVAQDVHDLGIGYDVQRLSLRQASAAVEWRFLVLLADGEPAHDSGWRPVDLAPAISDPIVTVEVRDPCDGMDRPEGVPEPSLGAQASRVNAIVKLEFVASHGRPFVQVDLARSRAGDGESNPFAAHGTVEHGFEAKWGTVGSWRNHTLELPVDVEAPEPPTGPTNGPCEATVGRETQEWVVDVGILGSDGAVEYKTQTLLVDVYLDAA